MCLHRRESAISLLQRLVLLKRYWWKGFVVTISMQGACPVFVFTLRFALPCAAPARQQGGCPAWPHARSHSPEHQLALSNACSTFVGRSCSLRVNEEDLARVGTICKGNCFLIPNLLPLQIYWGCPVEGRHVCMFSCWKNIICTRHWTTYVNACATHPVFRRKDRRKWEVAREPHPTSAFCSSLPFAPNPPSRLLLLR